MKQSRRQELKTNELSIYLQQAYDFANRNATYILGGVVVVVLIIVVGMLNTRSQHRAEVDALNKYNEIRRGDVTKDAKLLDDARALVADYGSHADLGPMVLDLQASLCNRLAISLGGDGNRARRLELLKQGREACERSIREFAQKPEVVARSRMTEAAIEESLLLEGESKLETIDKLYDEVIKGLVSPYQALAKELQSSLAERMAKLEVVATRPAEIAPAVSTLPASRPFTETLKFELPASKPSTATKPVAPQPTKAATKPAKSGAKAPAKSPAKSPAKPAK